MRDRRTKNIAIDFDGVLFPLAPEAPAALRELHGRARLVVFTARRDHEFVRSKLAEFGIAEYIDDVTSEKNRFHMIVDDMPLVHFTGDWGAVLRAAQELTR